MEDHAEDVDVGVLDRLRGEDVVCLEGDPGGEGGGEESVEAGAELGEVLDDAGDVGVFGGDFDREVAYGAAKLRIGKSAMDSAYCDTSERKCSSFLRKAEILTSTTVAVPNSDQFSPRWTCPTW